MAECHPAFSHHKRKSIMKLTRFLSEGAILQKNEAIPVRGWAEPGQEILAVLFRQGKETEPATESVQEKSTRAAEDGSFFLQLDPLPAGGPYELRMSAENGETLRIPNLLIGAVFYVSGQSNIDVDMERCRDSYPEIWGDCADDGLRTFRITENADYHGPLSEPLTGEWKTAGPGTIGAFSATGYFFARALREMTGMPVGFIQASLGGSRITSWLSREMLKGDKAYQPLLEEADRYADDAFLSGVIRQNESAPAAWKEALSLQDEGRKHSWELHPEEIRRKGTAIGVPGFFRDTELAGFIGSVWFTREFSVPVSMAGKSAGLWLGTMVDSDEVWVNGVKVGETGYQYPPRKYRIPEGALRTENTITIRLVVENGEGRFTPGKGYFVFNDQGAVDLTGQWFYRPGASCGPVPPTDFVNWKVTGLFNGTAAPCFQVPVEGMVWYQGEANTHQPYDYLDLMKRYAAGYRKLWGKEDLPLYYVQLPNYNVDLTNDTQWPELREKQRKALSVIPASGMAVTMDLGEDNDLHPHGKKEIGRRLALLAAHDLYGSREEYTGPVPERAELVSGMGDRGLSEESTESGAEGTGVPGGEEPGQRTGRTGTTIRISLTHADGLYADSADKGSVVRDAELVTKDGEVRTASVSFGEEDGRPVLLFSCPERIHPVEVRYAYHNVMHGALIYNGARLPMTPFVLNVEPEAEGAQTDRAE